MNKPDNYLQRRLRSFRDAIKGLGVLFLEEPHALIHSVAAVLVILTGWYFRLSHGEWIAILFAIGLVFIAELFNTALENLSDYVMPDQDEKIGRIKDLSAAAVLFAAMTAAIIGGIVFLPKVI